MIEDLKAEKRAAVRAAATARIEAVWPWWRQQNAARMAALFIDTGPAMACHDWVEAHRVTVDHFDGLIAAAPDAAALAAIDIDAGWPEP